MLVGAVSKQIEVKSNNNNSQVTLKKYGNHATTHRQVRMVKSANTEIKVNKTIERVTNTTTNTVSKIIDEKTKKQ